MSQVIVRRATSADRERIFEFLKKVHPMIWQYRIPDRWDWEFLNNPYRSDELPVWIALDQETGEVVGQNGALIEPLWMDGKIHRMSWGVDFYVLEAYRGYGLGKKLYGAMLEDADISLTLSMTDTARAVMLKIGMKPLPFVPVYTRILNHEPESVLVTLGKRLGINPEGAGGEKTLKLLRMTGLHKLAARILTGRERRRDAHLRQACSPEVFLQKVPEFPKEVNGLWEKISPTFNGLIHRDQRFLNWKFVEQPLMEYDIWLAHKGGGLSGYVVLRRGRLPERSAGIIADLFVLPEDKATVETLVAHSLRQFWKQEGAFVETASSVSAYQKVYKRFGFKQTGEKKPVILYDGQFPEDGWLFSRGDHDWDQYPEA